MARLLSLIAGAVLFSTAASAAIPEDQLDQFNKLISNSVIKTDIGCAGVAISPTLILSAGHCYRANEFTVTMEFGRQVQVQVIKVDPESDLMLLKASNFLFTPAEILQVSVKRGSEVYVVGHPAITEQADDWAVTTGVVSKLHNHNDYFSKADFTETDAFMFGGNSGGPVFDVHGKVIGIVSWGYHEPQTHLAVGLNFFVSNLTILEFLRGIDGVEGMVKTTPVK